MAILPKEIYRYNANLYLKKKKSTWQHGIFHRIRANNPKISHKRPQIAKTILRKKEQTILRKKNKGEKKRKKEQTPALLMSPPTPHTTKLYIVIKRA